jgi:FtsP/CotA-like multicopper oxidase with cupredoxin domain
MHRHRRLLSILFLSLLLAALIVAPTLAQDETTPPGVGEQPPPPADAAVPEVPPEVPVDASEAASTASTIIYNLYATDAFIPLADGSAVYNYGFVGGRQGVPLTYQQSVTPGGPRDPDTGLSTSFTYNGNGTIPTGAPAPTGGPVTAAEQPLLGNAQFPAPLIYAAVGDVVEIRLKNLGTTNPTAPNDPHSIHLHGLDVDAANDGVPETSVGAIPANSDDPGAGNVIVYMFSPKYAGTTMYHCHQEASIHVQMGMYGALVVYSSQDKWNPNSAYYKGGPGSGFGGTLFNWKYDKDYVLLESEIGAAQHVSEESSGDYNPVNYHPQYWFLNGLSFPNTIHVGLPELTPGTGWTDWIAAHPGYDPLITGSVSARSSAGTRGQRVLIRMINMGYETQPMHMHGYHGKVIGSDQRAWSWSSPAQQPFGIGLEKNTLLIGSGETYEWLVDFGQQKVTSTYPNGTGGLNGTFAGGTQTRYDPANNLPQSNTQTGLPAIDSYIAGPTVAGAVDLGGTSQLFPFHNHDDYKATNNGVYPGGMFTVLVPVP